MSELDSNSVDTFWAEIYIAGPRDVIEQTCRECCYHEPLCVTIEDVKFIYKGGEETGVVIGLVNYPRFPSTPEEIERTAIDLGGQIMLETCQESYLVVTPIASTWFTRRESNIPNPKDRS